MSIRSFRNLESTLGCKHEPHGLMSVVALRPYVKPASAITHDAMHILFSNGVMNYELIGLLSALKQETENLL